MRVVLPFLVGLVVLLSAGAAEARTRLINTEDEIVRVGSVPDELREFATDDAGHHFDQVGFHYSRIAIAGADLWSWSGHVVFFQAPQTTFEGWRTVETTWYVDVPDELEEKYGWSTPIEYRIPVGFLVALCLVEFAFIARKKRNAKRVLAIGIGLVLLSLVLFLLGLTWQIAFPLLLGLFHILISLPIFQPASNHEAAMAMPPLTDEEDDPPYKKAQPEQDEPRGPMLPPAPNFEKDPFRGPPQPPPVNVKRPPTTPAAAPVVRDENAEGPKLLR